MRDHVARDVTHNRKRGVDFPGERLRATAGDSLA
jgi:hypothetical protein